MVNFDPEFMTAFMVSILAVAAVTAVLTVAVAISGVVRNRKIRLIRRESIPTYYGRLVAHH
ncbi:hypothetical protein [Nocardioides sp. InS609-2]|uniref:hypothetical protein n=1 Tax=Nocardioides sp. InS609-2 TaxID=2760705 RepID=UPI001827EA70|nr:hypothetical protein [Nocardioides sp. InS609-2]MBA3783201.1 hypothetical protein [Nocardioides sp.]